MGTSSAEKVPRLHSKAWQFNVSGLGAQ